MRRRDFFAKAGAGIVLVEAAIAFGAGEQGTANKDYKPAPVSVSKQHVHTNGDIRSVVDVQRGWNVVQLPPGWTDVLIWAESISFDINGHHVDSTQPPGKPGAIMIGPDGGVTIWLTAENEKSAQRYWGIDNLRFTTSTSGGGNGSYEIVIRRN